MENIDLIIKIIIASGSIFTGIAALLAFFHLLTIKNSLLEAKRWNKLKTSFEFLNSESFVENEKYLNESFIKLMDRAAPLSPEEIEKLLKDESKNIRFTLKSYLNFIEDYCQAVNIGVVEESVAKRMYYYKLNRTYSEMKPFIEKMRIIHNENRLLCELEDVITRWNKEEKVDSISY